MAFSNLFINIFAKASVLPGLFRFYIYMAKKLAQKHHHNVLRFLLLLLSLYKTFRIKIFTLVLIYTQLNIQ